jgi:hypothetical protein
MVTGRRCSGCRHAVADAGELERGIAGLAILSSAFGSTAGETTLCPKHGHFVARSGACDGFAQISAQERAGLEGFGEPP